MSEGKKELLDLEKTGKYFFHGSPYEIEIFEPRQSHNDIDGDLVPDGEPAISASPSADYAIFMAIFNIKNCPNGFTSRVNTSSKTEDAEEFTLTFLATQKAIDQLDTHSSGWVYVFSKESFSVKHGPSEYRSMTPVRPLKCILVKRDDLPQTVLLPLQN